MPVQTPVPIRLPGSFPPNVPQPFGYNSSPLPPPSDYYVSRKELLEIAPDLGVMKSVPSAANDTVVLFDDKGQVKSSGVKLSDKADTETVETLVGEDEGKSARAIAKEEVKQLLGEDPNELYDTFTEVSEFIDEAKQNYQAINNALSETAKSLSTKADKTALTAEVARATQSEAQIDGKINTIIADDAGKSARTIAAEEVAKVVADAPADFDTLKEIAEYIESDKTGAAQMVTKIDDNANAIAAETHRAQEAEAALRGAVDGKADKVANATSGNLVAIGNDGNLVDSGNMVAGAFTAGSFIGGGSGLGFELNSTDKWVELYIGLPGGFILKFPLHGDTLAVQDDIAPMFDKTNTYDEGALVFHDGLYRCVNPNGHTGEWLEADFSMVTVKDVLADKANASSLAPVATSGNYDDLRGRPGNVSAFANDAGYLTAHQSWSDVKPSGGITASDLAAAVQTSLGKADTALQAHQDISGKADKVANATSGNLAALDENGNLADSGKAIGDFALAESLAPKYVLYNAYEVGDLCTSFDNEEYHRGTWLYKCILATDGSQLTMPEIDPTHWALATVEDVLAALRRTVEGKVDKEAGKGLSTNDYTNEDKEKLGTAYTPDNPPPAPDLSGYATKVAVEDLQGSVNSVWSALTEVSNKADAALPRYLFTSAGISDGVVTIPPYVYASMLSDGTAFTVAVGEDNIYMRDCILIVECSDVAPTITWPANFHPRTDAETDFACVAGAMNVYWISEYAQGEFVVAGWQATAGGNAA